MTINKKRKPNYSDISEYKKDTILSYIISQEVSIKKAAEDLNISITFIDRIFAERFGKRTRKNTSDLNPRKEYYKKYWIENKLK
tara:strand:- start:373 stop:624 length:252 start_codon:yes stop_codon:yes gene_type:complete